MILVRGYECAPSLEGRAQRAVRGITGGQAWSQRAIIGRG